MHVWTASRPRSTPSTRTPTATWRRTTSTGSGAGSSGRWTWRTAHPRPRRCTRARRRYWQGLVGVLDGDGDGRLSWEEYARVHEPAEYEDHVRPYADALTAICDRDDDGFVQHADFVRGMRAVGFPADNVEALFRAFDPQATGRVATSEWRTAIEEYFLARGTHAVGDTLV